jgi:hypothetical protein
MHVCGVYLCRQITASPKVSSAGGLPHPDTSCPSSSAANSASLALTGPALPASLIRGQAAGPPCSEEVSTIERSAASSPSLGGRCLLQQQILHGHGDNSWLLEGNNGRFSGSSPLQRSPQTTGPLLPSDRVGSAGTGGMTRASVLMVEGRSRGHSFTALGALKRPEKSSSSLWPGLGLTTIGPGPARSSSRPDLVALGATSGEELAGEGTSAAVHTEVASPGRAARLPDLAGQRVEYAGETSAAGGLMSARTDRSSSILMVSQH